MDTEHEQFEQVRKLLALKKYEQPPPRYFAEFSGKVISRLHALEAARPAAWRQRLGLDFDFRPAMLGAFGVVVCGLLLVGVVTSLGVSQPSTPGLAAGEPSPFFAAPTADSAFAAGAVMTPAFRPDENTDSTTPMPFGQITPQAQRVGFTPFGSGN